MSDSYQLPDDDPRIVAWAAFKQTPEFANAKHWAGEFPDGSLWAAFAGGYRAALGILTEGGDAQGPSA